MVKTYSVDECIKNSKYIAESKNVIGNMGIHRHDFYEIEFILDGSGTYNVDGVSYPIQRGILFALSPICIHRPIFTERTKLMDIMITSISCHISLLSTFISDKSYLVLNLSESELQFFHTLGLELENYSKSQDALSDQFASLLINCILGKISTLNSTEVKDVNQTSIQHAMLYIQSNISQNIFLRDVAKLTNYSPNYFGEVFRKYTGSTFKQYVIQQRLSFAKNLLTYTNLPIAQIAEQSGFNDLSNFMVMFKQHCGMTPNTFRKNNRLLSESDNF